MVALYLTYVSLLSLHAQVKNRTSNHGTFREGSHVMQFGTLALEKVKSKVLGEDVAYKQVADEVEATTTTLGVVEQREADMVSLLYSMRATPVGSDERVRPPHYPHV